MNSWEKPIIDENEYEEWKVGQRMVAGVQLTESQLFDPSVALSTQQTADYLMNLETEGQRFSFEDNSWNLPVPLVLQSSQATVTTTTTAVSVVSASERKYGSPKKDTDVKKAQESSIPARTKASTNWCVKAWEDWALARNGKLLPGEAPFSTTFTVSEMNYWLSKYVLEIRKRNGETYPPDTLYQLICGLQRLLKEKGRAEIKLFEDPSLHGFKTTLDAEMKRLNGTGKYINKKQAQPITVEQEETLWEMHLLGDHNPEVLLNTLVYYTGPLRSGMEHRRLRHSPSQFELKEPASGRASLTYREDVSKTNQGGLTSRKRKPKEVVHYANNHHPERCIVRLFKLYNSRCPEKRPNNAFYLTPLRLPKTDVWYSVTPLGHNQLSKIVGNLMKDAGFPGHYTNHSLRVSCATRLYDAQVDEQLIMGRTSHSSTDGVRAYKRSSEKLKELTSDILNSRGDSEALPKPALKRRCKEGSSVSDESSAMPKICICGGTNITINIGNP